MVNAPIHSSSDEEVDGSPKTTTRGQDEHSSHESRPIGPSLKEEEQLNNSSLNHEPRLTELRYQTMQSMCESLSMNFISPQIKLSRLNNTLASPRGSATPRRCERKGSDQHVHLDRIDGSSLFWQNSFTWLAFRCSAPGGPSLLRGRLLWTRGTGSCSTSKNAPRETI